MTVKEIQNYLDELIYDNEIESYQFKIDDDGIYCLDMTINGGWVRLYKPNCCNGNINAWKNIKVDLIDYQIIKDTVNKYK